VKDELCYHFTMDRKDVYVPVPEAMVEIFKKLHSMLYVHTHSLLPRLPRLYICCLDPRSEPFLVSFSDLTREGLVTVGSFLKLSFDH